ncbi:hypothetical protein MMC29_000327, partial [Sticta canariensis]|nr:hypothetical protein [Sticta canariensis]
MVYLSAARSKAGGMCAGRAGILELGSKLVEPTEAFAQQPFISEPESRPFRLHESHQDQISELPPGATLLASSRKTPIEIWSKDDQVFCIQGHPEFFGDFMHALVEWRQANGTANEQEIAQAHQELREHPVTAEDLAIIQHTCRRFLH